MIYLFLILLWVHSIVGSGPDDAESVSSLSVVTEHTDLSSPGNVSRRIAHDHRLARLIYLIHDFYNTVALLPFGSEFQPLSVSDMLDVSQWINTHVDPPVYDDYVLTLGNLTDQLSNGNISLGDDWRVLSMMSSHLSLIPLIHSTGAVFHVSNHLRLVWRRIANNTPLRFIDSAMSILRTGLMHAKHKLVIDFVLALFRSIDGQLVPVDQLHQLIHIGDSMNSIMSAIDSSYPITETLKMITSTIETELDLESICLMGRWDGGAEVSVDYVIDSVFGRVSRMENRFDQLERLVETFSLMEKFFEEKFGKIPQEIIGGSVKTTIRSPTFLTSLLHNMTVEQLDKYLDMSSGILLGIGGSLSNWLTLNAALHLGTPDSHGSLASVLGESFDPPNASVVRFDQALTEKWLSGKKSVWEWDGIGTVMNASILVRIVGAASSMDLIGRARKILSAMAQVHRDKAAITTDLIIPCKQAINRMVEELRSN